MRHFFSLYGSLVSRRKLLKIAILSENHESSGNAYGCACMFTRELVHLCSKAGRTPLSVEEGLIRLFANRAADLPLVLVFLTVRFQYPPRALRLPLRLKSFRFLFIANL
jgi:hypothetical protein